MASEAIHAQMVGKGGKDVCNCCWQGHTTTHPSRHSPHLLCILPLVSSAVQCSSCPLLDVTSTALCVMIELITLQSRHLSLCLGHTGRHLRRHQADAASISMVDVQLHDIFLPAAFKTQVILQYAIPSQAPRSM